MSLISDLFAGGTEGVLKGVKDIVSTFKADPLELAKLEAAINKAELDFQLGLSQAQTKINEIEAASQDRFVSRWRPSIGWVCVFAYAYTFVLQPAISFGLVAAGVHYNANELPKLEMAELSMVLAGMLGLGAMRSFDKLKK
jgi:hypothetical protein